MNKKECPVCQLLISEGLFSNYINTRLKRNVKVKEVIQDFISKKLFINDKPPTKYYLEQHKLNCLNNFVLEPLTSVNLELTDNCTVCLLLKDNEVFEKFINTRLKQNVKIKEITQDFTNRKYNPPTKHYLELHKNNCLINFEVDLPTIEDLKQENLINETSLEEILDSHKNFINTPLIEKNQLYQNILHCIYKKLLIDTLTNDSNLKVNIPQIKTLHEILNPSVDVSNITEKEIDSSEDLEAFALNLIASILNKKVISENTILTMAKLFIKDSNKIEMLKNKDSSGEHSDEEKEQLALDFMAFNNAKTKN